MTSCEFRERLARCAIRAGAPIPPSESIDLLSRYFSILSKWNQRMNLTALPLQPPTDETFDRLLIEPLLAARYLPDRPDPGSDLWMDLGSGAGSPAIPLKITRPESTLVMVEAKTRKAAFLREVVRTLGLAAATVENARFEHVATRRPGDVGLVTVRAIRVDQVLARSVASLLRMEGRLLLFKADAQVLKLKGFKPVETVKLSNSESSYLGMYERVFHVEQSN